MFGYSVAHKRHHLAAAIASNGIIHASVGSNMATRDSHTGNVNIQYGYGGVHAGFVGRDERTHPPLSRLCRMAADGHL